MVSAPLLSHFNCKVVNIEFHLQEVLIMKFLLKAFLVGFVAKKIAKSYLNKKSVA